MKTRDFHYELPAALIAQAPAEQRSASRLLKLDRARDEISHHHFNELADFLQAGDLLVFNDTRVIPARLYGHKSSGGKVEILIERLLDEQRCLAHIRASKSPKAGAHITIENSPHALTVTGRQQDLFELCCDQGIKLSELMQQSGHMPLPPYITRADEALDHERYQTVYARQPGAVAAPTAGLHFDEALLQRLRQQGVEFSYVTLHVGAGTFQPVRSENIVDHKMHAEYIDVSERHRTRLSAGKGAWRAYHRRGHDLGTLPGKCIGQRRAETVSRRYRHIHLSRLSLSQRRCADHQFSFA